MPMTFTKGLVIVVVVVAKYLCWIHKTFLKIILWVNISMAHAKAYPSLELFSE